MSQMSAWVRPDYASDVDFRLLGLENADFRKVLKQNGQLDFSDPKSIKELTNALLQRDFGLTLELPENRLCPPVPNRYNYVRFIEDLLITSRRNQDSEKVLNDDIVGLDIGTGASCIYPLLACKMLRSWKFFATDIDEKNMTYAKINITSNQLRSRIRPLLTTTSDPLLPFELLSIGSIDFTMCNPPFYSSKEEMETSAAAKARPAHSACTGALVEMVTAGGEVAFVSCMIKESHKLKSRCQWFTSMLGKASSVGIIVQRLKAEGITNWAVKDLVQGTKTKRWVVAWSWQSRRPADEVARASTTVAKTLLPFPALLTVPLAGANLTCLVKKLDALMATLDLWWIPNSTLKNGIAICSRNVWSRSSRRQVSSKSEKIKSAEPALIVEIQVSQSPVQEYQLQVRWLQGLDHVLFESFVGMLKRRLGEE